MVMSNHETDSPEWPKWKWWLIRIFGASIVFGFAWWLPSRNWTESLFAAALPWALAIIFLAISLIWAVATIPLMLLLGKISGRKSSKDSTK